MQHWRAALVHPASWQHVGDLRCWRWRRAIGLLVTMLLTRAIAQTELNVKLTRTTPQYSGLIRVQGGRFVDAACNVFPVVGLNACAPGAHTAILYTMFL